MDELLTQLGKTAKMGRKGIRNGGKSVRRAINTLGKALDERFQGGVRRLSRRVRGRPKRKKVAAAPAAVNSSRKARTPKVGNKPGLTVSHTERLMSVTSTDEFTLSSFAVNPGRSNLFAWGSTLARAWQKYILRSLSVEYRPSCPSTTPGMIYLAFGSDPTAESPDSVDDFSNYRGASSGNYWAPFSMTAPVDGVRRYIRTAELGPNLDRKFFDTGELHIGTAEGLTANNGMVTGSLHIKYTFDVYDPQSTKLNVEEYAFRVESGEPVTYDAPFGELATRTCTGSLAVTVNNAGTTLTFGKGSRGSYVLNYLVEGTGAYAPGKAFDTTGSTVTYTEGNGTVIPGGNTVMGYGFLEVKQTNQKFVAKFVPFSKAGATVSSCDIWLTPATDPKPSDPRADIGLVGGEPWYRMNVTTPGALDAPLGSAAIDEHGDLDCARFSDNRISLPGVGQYYCVVRCTGTSLVPGNPVADGADSTVVTYCGNFTNAAATAGVTVVEVNATQDDANVVFDYAGLAASLTAVVVYIFRWEFDWAAIEPPA